MNRTWSSEQLELLKVQYPTQDNATLQLLFPDKTKIAIKAKALVLGLKKTKQRFKYSPDDIEYLKHNYANTASEDIAIRFGCSLSSLYQMAQKLGLKKDIEFIRQSAADRITNPNHGGRKSQFKKGSTSSNKGKKQIEFMSPEAIEATKATRFQKGQTPQNHKPIGYERVTRDGYIEVKVAEPNKFKLKHRIVWEKHNGKIEKGFNIQFRDGNRQNCNIENLYIIDRQDQMKENSGSLNMTDGMVAMWIVGGHGKDKELREIVKAHLDLIELKRKQLTLNREIKCKQKD